MGTWGFGSFENDNAGDWVWGLEKAADTSILESAFLKVIESADNLQAPDCEEAIAAADVVASLRGRLGKNPPPEVEEYTARIASAPTQALVDLALRATQRIKTKSELLDCFIESDGSAEWLQSVAELEARLKD